MKERGKNRVFWLVIALAVAGVSWYVKQEKEGGGKDTWTSGKTGAEVDMGIVPDEPVSVPSSGGKQPKKVERTESAFTKSLTSARVTNRKFEVLEGCKLKEHRNNDGDSFHVLHGGKETEFRLYFVDTAESQYKSYRDGNNNGDRIREQGDYFGGLDREQTTALGTAAKKFALNLLDKRKFTVVTQWENVYGPDRKYCFVIVNWKGKDVWLHELLVAQGLVRIHTKPFTLPDNTSASRQRKKLKALEADAKKAKRGGWSL